MDDQFPYHQNNILNFFRQQFLPIVPGKVYFLPGHHDVPLHSIAHSQKRQDGFFNHPVLVVATDKTFASFYAMTRCPPKAIRELNMGMRVGRTSADEGPTVLSLAEGASPMAADTFVNLEQMYYIEQQCLRDWTVNNVTIGNSELTKIQTRIMELEAQQNRYIYKPLPRDLSNALPGTILMLPNSRGSPTFGAPVLVVENNYPSFTYYRIKLIRDNWNFAEPLDPNLADFRKKCLVIKQQLCFGHDETPVILIEPTSQNIREPSYIEVGYKPKTGRLDECKTWCYPHIKIQDHSMKLLLQYASKLYGYMAKPKQQHHIQQQLPAWYLYQPLLSQQTMWPWYPHTIPDHSTHQYHHRQESFNLNPSVDGWVRSNSISTESSCSGSETGARNMYYRY